MKRTILALSLVSLFIVSPLRAADNYCASNSEATCAKVSGCTWKPGETWTRESDGKIRTKSAGCRFSSRAAREALAILTTK